VDQGAYDTADKALTDLRDQYPSNSETMNKTVEYLDIVNSLRATGFHDSPVTRVDGIWKKLVEEEQQQLQFTETINNR
jgi:endonuclease III-like uncharacterized protein